MSIIASPVLKTGFFIAVWYLFNLLTVLGNKYLFNFYHFVYPFSLTAIHMVCCFIGAVILLKGVQWQPFKEVTREHYFRKILPLAVMYCINIGLGNVSLRLVPVSFMQTVKSSVPAFNVLGQLIFLNNRFSRSVYISLVPVVLGVMLATWTEVNFDMAGFMAAVFSSIFTAALAVMSGLILTGNDKLSSFNVMYYMSPPSFVMLAPFSLFFEVESIVTEWQPPSALHAVCMLGLSGLVAVMLNVATFLAIANTSALSFNVAGNVKSVINIIVSVLVYRNEITFLNAFGCAVTVFGVMLYGYVTQEKKPKLTTPELGTTSDPRSEVGVTGPMLVAPRAGVKEDA